MKIKRNIKFFILKLKIIRKVFKSKHVCVLYIPTSDLIKIIEGDAKDITNIKISYAGMMYHQCQQLIQRAGEMPSNTDIICEKAIFDSQFENNE